ncbi:hypothetical protein GCM10023165_44690 [Variovorax defluvii]|uniref:NAD(P)-dependent oxidoreductase n=1 Tax=Variovorax defluvii TaxID=913761 RepID=A0ABP8I9C5_9BURK
MNSMTLDDVRVGYIGLGAMGGRLARRLQKQTRLHVWDLNAVQVEAIAQEGAQAAPDAAELARCCDVVFLSLPRTQDVEQLVFGPRGLMGGLRPGMLVIDQTSGAPEATRSIGERLRANGVAMVDAPVSGTPAAAAAGECTVLYSGAPQDVDRALPWLKVISAKLFPCGVRLGDAQAVKLINNTINTGCRAATLEMAALGGKCGLRLKEIADALNEGEGCNRPSQLMLTALADGRVSTNFALKHVVKDINQCLEMATPLDVPMPIAGVVRGVLQVGCNTLGPAAQLEDIVSLTESMCAAPIRPAKTEQAVLEGAERAGLLKLIDGAVAACNERVTREALAVGVKAEMDLGRMLAAIRASSGWSRALDRIDAEELHRGCGSGGSDVLARDALRRVFALAVELEVPLLIVNGVRSSIEAIVVDGVGSRQDLPALASAAC